MDIFKRPIALLDFETTGEEAGYHEIVEIGLIVFDQATFDIIHTYECKIRPHFPGRMSQRAKRISPYNEEEWKSALTLKEALKPLVRMMKDSILCAHNTTFENGFLDAALKETGISIDMDYHAIDIPSLAYGLLKRKGLASLNMGEIAKFFGIPEEPIPHRAINGAKVEYEFFKKLMTV